MTTKKEPVVKYIELDERVLAAKVSPDEMEKLIQDFQPFLYGRAGKYAIKANSHLREDLFSTAQMAFYEAIKTYNADKGHFFPFAGNVVRNKLIDHIRKLYRQGVPSASIELTDEDNPQSEALEQISVKMFASDQQRCAIVEEIERFKGELATWKISMDALVKHSPKHQKVKDTYKLLIRQIIADPDVVRTILSKRYIPMKTIAGLSGLPQKKLERARTYIIASLIIKMGDYDYLSEYIDGGR